MEVSVPVSPTRSGKSMSSPHMATPDIIPLGSMASKEPAAELMPVFDLDEEIENDGLTADQLFANSVARPALTYGDLILLPGHVYFGTDDVVIKTKLTKNIELAAPFISSPMDTVTESEMAIQMALNGGIGIIHYNNTIKEQRKMVDRVKNFKNGFITAPKTLKADDLLHEVLEIKNRYGFSGIPVTENGKVGSKLIGLITNRDMDFCKDPTVKVSELMTPLADLVRFFLPQSPSDDRTSIQPPCYYHRPGYSAAEVRAAHRWWARRRRP